MIAASEVSATEVTDHFLSRIEELNPKLHAMKIVDDDGAREQARRADKAVLVGEALGPLHGIPMAVFEVLRVKGFPTNPFGIAETGFDLIGIERLRKAGAVILGLTAGYFQQPDTRLRNPWDLRMDPGNSCRGSAAAASAALVPITIAGDTAGSTRLPGSFSGVVGVHPTRGLVPHVDYDFPSVLMHTSVGPMARSVRDCAIALQAMAGPDGRDHFCIQNDPPDFLARIDDGVEGMRLAWTDDFGWSGVHAVEETPRVTELARSAAMNMSSLGARVDKVSEVWEDPALAWNTLSIAFASLEGVPNIMGKILEHERIYDAAAGLPVQPEMNFEMPTISADAYRAAAESRARNWETFRRVFAEYDVLLCPTTLMVTRPVEEWGNFGRHWAMTTYSAHTSMFNVLGFPAVTVPCGFVDGLPVGLQVVAGPGREDVIFRVANTFQKAFGPTERPPLG
jgi:Asp-tRNA(Asn)/Glu-tRNA(Gln) amidotransferase A subunit family amidase